MNHKKITEMTQEEMNAYIEELRPHLEALARGEQYMFGALMNVAEAIAEEAPIDRAPLPELNNCVFIAPLITDSYLIDLNDLTKSAVIDACLDDNHFNHMDNMGSKVIADGEEPADD